MSALRQQVAWNGISFQAPLSWQPVVILNDYLLFEDQYQPVCEIKWKQVRGSVSVERLLKQLRGSAKKKGSKKGSLEQQISEEPVPDQWQQELARYNSYCFTWQGSANRGTGLLLHCPHCDLTILLQLYYHEKRDQFDPVFQHLITTLRCHQQGESQAWSIYDLAFSLPAEAVLQTQEFNTGRYVISFQLDEFSFSLLRFKPARVLLEGGGLDKLARQLLVHGEERISGEEGVDMDGDGYGYGCWQREADRFQRFKANLRRRQADHFLCLRHDAAENVILGVQAQSNQAIDTSRIEGFLRRCKAR